jgi:hypothetical protein
MLSRPFLDHTLMAVRIPSAPIFDRRCNEYPWPKTETKSEEKDQESRRLRRSNTVARGGVGHDPADDLGGHLVVERVDALVTVAPRARA